jgi:hypothetical protein
MSEPAAALAESQRPRIVTDLPCGTGVDSEWRNRERVRATLAGYMNRLESNNAVPGLQILGRRFFFEPTLLDDLISALT